MKLNIIIPLLLLFFGNNCGTIPENEPGVVKIQELNNFRLDGLDDEWQAIPYRKLYADPLGNYPDDTDLRAGFKLAWKGEDLLLFATIVDDELSADSIFPWKGDAVELFLTDSQGSPDIVQFSVVTGVREKKTAIVRIQDYRSVATNGWREPWTDNRIIHSGDTIHLEMQVNYRIFGQVPETADLYFQLYIDDNDPLKGNRRNQLTWYPLGNSYMNSYAYQKVEPTKMENSIPAGTSRLVITDRNKVELFVFGSESGDKIRVMKGDRIILDTISSSEAGIPDLLDLSAAGLDLKNDSVFVYLNDHFLSFHNLILSPAVYTKLKPPRFETEINIFRLKDRISMPGPGGALFIGSSSMRMWKSIYSDFPELRVIHRGFGGSNSADALEYMNDIVLPYKPAIIVYYEGDNDLAQNMPREEIISNIKEFIDRARSNNPGVKICLLSPKPAIVRMHLWQKYLLLHEKMKELASQYQDVVYVDVASAMFDNSGNLIKDIFSDDSLHMNEEGYRIWTRVVRNSLGLEKNQ